MKSFVLAKHAHFKVVLGTDATGKLYSVEGIPTNLVLNSSGKIIYAAEGFDQKGILAAVRRAKQ